MGLAAIFAKGAALGMKLAGDAKSSVTVYGEGSLAGGYDVATDQTTTTWGKTKPGVLALLSDEYEEQDKKTIGGKPERKYMDALIEGAELAGWNLDAEMELDAKGGRWKVEKVSTDPVRALITLICYR